MKSLKKTLKTLLIVIGLFAILITVLYGYRDIPISELKEIYANAPSAFISVDGMDVHYRDEGNVSDSIPIVLIHGTGASLHTFNDWATVLKKEHRVIRMDLPAFGLTGPFPNRDYSINHYVSFLAHFLNEKKIDKCILAGNSLGGRIVW
ncbi:MAG: alpha/beta hydrolase, partial [Flavobacteriaceae bacterium]|nr:alpha/beta hydrolase [Flavobacteriaceae bacterium]